MVLHVHRKTLKPILTLIVSVILMVSAASAGVHAEGEEVRLSAAYHATAEKLQSIGEAASWSKDTSWIVFCLARAGILSDADALRYYEASAAQAAARGSARLSDTEATANARTIIALTAAGFDVHDVGGYDLLEPLADPAYVSRQGINGPIWCLIALDSGHYEIPETNGATQTTREGLVNTILNAQLTSSGVRTGWTFSGTAPDVDMTCMALTALAPYEQARDAIDAALSWLSSVQDNTGSFASGGLITSESSSQVIVALTSLGLNPQKDSRFLKKGKSALHSLLSFYVTGGGFRHISSNVKMNNMASIQAFYALTAYYRFLDGANTLYDMADCHDSYHVPATEKEDVVLTSEASADNSSKTPGKSASGRTKTSSSKSKISKTPSSKSSNSKKKVSKSSGSNSSATATQRTARTTTPSTVSRPASSASRTTGDQKYNAHDNGPVSADAAPEEPVNSPEPYSATPVAAPKINEVRSMRGAIPWAILGILASGVLAAVIVIKRRGLRHE